jgi:hypothetical protein
VIIGVLGQRVALVLSGRFGWTWINTTDSVSAYLSPEGMQKTNNPAWMMAQGHRSSTPDR